MTNKICETQASALHFAVTQTTTSSYKEPIDRLQELTTLLNELTRERGANDSNKSSELEVLELKDLLEDVNSLKETLRREMAISKGLRRTIEKLQEENNVLPAKTTKQERVEESKGMSSDISKLRERVHELEKENELLQQKLMKKDKELERFQGQETGAVFDSIVTF